MKKIEEEKARFYSLIKDSTNTCGCSSNPTVMAKLATLFYEYLSMLDSENDKELYTLEQKCNALQADNDKLETDNMALRRHVVKVDKEYTASKSKNDEKTAIIDSLMKKLGEREITITNLRKEVKDILEDRDDTLHKLFDVGKENTKLEEENNLLNFEVENLTNTINKLDETNNKLNAKLYLNNHNGIAGGARERIKKLECEVKVLHDQIAAANDLYVEEKSKNTKLEAENGKLRELVEEFSAPYFTMKYNEYEVYYPGTMVMHKNVLYMNISKSLGVEPTRLSLDNWTEVNIRGCTILDVLPDDAFRGIYANETHISTLIDKLRMFKRKMENIYNERPGIDEFYDSYDEIIDKAMAIMTNHNDVYNWLTNRGQIKQN